MASTYPDVAEESRQQHFGHHHHHHHQQQQQAQSPKDLKRTWSTNSSACGDATANGAPRCVCAPATHARSFKCRLHRVNSQGHSAPSTAALPPQPSVSASATRTVEAL